MEIEVAFREYLEEGLAVKIDLVIALICLIVDVRVCKSAIE